MCYEKSIFMIWIFDEIWEQNSTESFQCFNSNQRFGFNLKYVRRICTVRLSNPLFSTQIQNWDNYVSTWTRYLRHLFYGLFMIYASSRYSQMSRSPQAGTI